MNTAVSKPPYGAGRFSATVSAENLRSKRVLEKLGFSQVAHLANYFEKDGQKIGADVYEYSVDFDEDDI